MRSYVTLILGRSEEVINTASQVSMMLPRYYAPDNEEHGDTASKARRSHGIGYIYEHIFPNKIVMGATGLHARLHVGFEPDSIRKARQSLTRLVLAVARRRKRDDCGLLAVVIGIMT